MGRTKERRIYLVRWGRHGEVIALSTSIVRSVQRGLEEIKEWGEPANHSPNSNDARRILAQQEFVTFTATNENGLTNEITITAWPNE